MTNKTDVEIAREFAPRQINDIAGPLGVSPDDLLPYGKELGKVHTNALTRQTSSKNNKLILVSAITPTPAGEGKTTTTIGLGQAFTQLKKSVCLALREPSLGPCMGIKGGACGGGYSQVMPMDRINLHFTGDFHAITSANNLLASLIDNHIYFGNSLGIDPRRIVWRRVMDMNDRGLRHMVMGLGGRFQGHPREGGFDITAASEVMAMLCLSQDANDLRNRINRTLIGYTWTGKPILAEELKGTGAMMALLRDALHPNLVQTFEGTPVFMHGGPFANIAHGCNSVIATKMAMHHAEWAITEAGFGFDLGAEKFFDIKCKKANLNPSAVVLVATIRALKMHGGADKNALDIPNENAVELGLPNLEKHLESVRLFKKPVVVAVNQFSSDTPKEIEIIKNFCSTKNIPFAISNHHAEGGKGAIDLAKVVMKVAESKQTPLQTLYQSKDSIAKKIHSVAKKMYGADDVVFTKVAEKEMRLAEDLGYGHLPVCIAKAPSSLSDDPALRGRPRDFEITVRGVTINSGAGFLVVLTGNIMRMPGLPKIPLAHGIDLDPNGEILGME